MIRVALIMGVSALWILAGSGISYAYETRAEDQYVPRSEYEKLKQEVETLKAALQPMLKQGKEVPSERSSKAETGLKSEAAVIPQTEPKQPEVSQPAEKTAQQPQVSQPAEKTAQTKESLELSEGNRQQEAEEAKRQLDFFLRQQKVIFKPGELTAQFSLAYAQDTAENTCLGFGVRFCEPGSPITPKLTSRSLLAGFSAIYGLVNNVELNFAVPFGYVKQEQDFTPFSVPIPYQQENHTGLGDVSLGLRYAALREDAGRPDVTLNLNVKLRTGDEDKGLGTGHWNAGAGITLVKTIDPVIFFGSLGYIWTLERQGIDPGDQIPYSFGMGFSLNDRVSFLTTVAGALVTRTEVDGREIEGSDQDIGTLRFSTTVQLSKNLYLEPFVSAGLTNDATDFLFGISIPYRFN
jgi:hypothetical protein